MSLGTTAELDFMLKDAGEPIAYGSAPVQTTYGLFDRAPLQALTDAGLTVVGRKTYLTIRDGSLTGLAQDTAITVKGVTYSIRDIGFGDDDGTRKLELVDP